APNPWAIMVAVVQKNTKPTSRPAALAFLAQAEEYYRSAIQSGLTSAKPVLLYYCYMNIVKAFILLNAPHTNLAQPKHGLSEQISQDGKELVDAYLDAFRSGHVVINLFDSFLAMLTGRHLSAPKVRYNLLPLMAQVVTGHRLWSQATGNRERFIAI